MENPASKLHSILEKAYIISPNSFKPERYKTVWAKVFNVDENDILSIMNNIIGMINLYNETLKLIVQDERLNTEKNLKFMNRIENAILTVDMEGDANCFSEYMNQETLTALSYIAEHLSFAYNLNEIKVDNKKVDEIIVEVNELIHSISESPLPKDVQNILINNLILIKDALDRYRFLGEDELRKAIEQTIGSIAINKSIIAENQDDSIYPRFGGVIGNVSSLITIGTAINDYLLPFFDKIPLK